MRFHWLMALILALVLAMGMTMLACGDDDDDDDDDLTDDDDNEADDDAADDDATDDDVTDDDVADDDVTDDDTAGDDDLTGDPFVDGGFDEDSWAPCEGALCTQVIYATVSNVFAVSQSTDPLTSVGSTAHIMVTWQMAGDTVAGDYSLLIEGKATLTHFALLYVNVEVVSSTDMTYDVVYISTGGNMHIGEIGTGMGDAFSGELQDVEWTEAEINGNQVSVNFEGRTGTIDSILAAGSVIRFPM